MHDLTFLKITSLIIHELPKRQPAVTAGILSDTQSPLTEQVRHFFEECIRTALTSGGIPVAFVDGHASPVPASVRDLLSKPKAKFVATTQRIASHLFQLQTAVHSEGLLCVAVCTMGKAKGVAIIKLELEEGVRAELKGPKGKQHFEIHIIDDLMLTKNTKVFKVALFEIDAVTPETVLGRACDNQRARAQLVAGYFLDAFLGCTLMDQPDLMTKKFFEAAEVFINSQVTDPTTQARYATAVISELNSNFAVVRPRIFVNHHLDAVDRSRFLRALREADVSTTNFQKDITLIRTRLARTRFDFHGGVSVFAPPESINQSVTLRPSDDGKTRLEVIAKLESMRGAR